ncbi:ATP-binding cassette domain-containing protein [Citricoccus alkalitolerans]|uniref:ATP-binding cassette domain-containing protein n=1 Tax=Citricoccus alkalitolerans TaxID=246603 RepID=A0ABV8XUX9_9MICC
MHQSRCPTPASSTRTPCPGQESAGAAVGRRMIVGREATHRVSAAQGSVSLPPIVAEQYPQHLSAGERQRVSIARALLTQPKMLIGDGITSALDSSGKRGSSNLLRRSIGC